MSTKLEKLTKSESALQAELMKLEATRDAKYKALSAAVKPSDAAVLEVASIDVKLPILRAKYAEARTAAEAERARLDGPEGRAAIKKVATLKSELEAAQGQIAKALRAVQAQVAEMQPKLDAWRAQRLVAGEDVINFGFDELPMWFTNARDLLAAAEQRGMLK